MTDPFGIRPAPGPDQPPIPVRLVTFNTHHGVGEDDRHDLPRLARVLAAADADVICLQEVDRWFGDRSEDVDQAMLLSRALDMQLAWGPAIDEPHARRPSPPAVRQRAAVPAAHPDQRRPPAARQRRAAQRPAHDAGARRRHAVGDRDPPHHPVGRRAGGAGGRPGRAAHRGDGLRGPRGRLQRPARRPGAAPAARALHRCLGAGRGPRRPGRLALLAARRGAHPPGALRRTAGSTRRGSPPASPSPRHGCWTPRGRRTTCRSWWTCASPPASAGLHLPTREASYVQAAGSSRRRWLITPVMPSPRMLTP